MHFIQIDARDNKSVLKMMNEVFDQLVGLQVKKAPLKDIYMFFLLAINKDFDDDLLQDIIELILDL